LAGGGGKRKREGKCHQKKKSKHCNCENERKKKRPAIRREVRQSVLMSMANPKSLIAHEKEKGEVRMKSHLPEKKRSKESSAIARVQVISSFMLKWGKPSIFSLQRKSEGN